jgi:ribonuclease P protein component
MLPRHLRLTKNADILRIMRQGKKISTPYVWIYFLKRDDKKPSRAASVVSKKVHKLAVKRHRYQRWLRQLSKAHISRLPLAHDMVWVARPKITEVKKITELQSSLQGHLDISIK